MAPGLTCLLISSLVCRLQKLTLPSSWRTGSARWHISYFKEQAELLLQKVVCPHRIPVDLVWSQIPIHLLVGGLKPQFTKWDRRFGFPRGLCCPVLSLNKLVPWFIGLFPVERMVSLVVVRLKFPQCIRIDPIDPLSRLEDQT